MFADAPRQLAEHRPVRPYVGPIAFVVIALGVALTLGAQSNAVAQPRFAASRRPIIIFSVEPTTSTTTTTTTTTTISPSTSTTSAAGAGATTTTAPFAVIQLSPNDPRCRSRLTTTAQLERQKAKVLTNLARSVTRLRKAEADGRPILAAALADEVAAGEARVAAIQAEIDLLKLRCP